MGTRRGQALMELAVGMFALALVVSALTTFAVYIAKSLRSQNAARAQFDEGDTTVELDRFAAEWFFPGKTKLEAKEKNAKMPDRAVTNAL